MFFRLGRLPETLPRPSATIRRIVFLANIQAHPLAFVLATELATLATVRKPGIKSSAVAEMGDRLATIDMCRKVGAAVPVPFSLRELGPRV